MLRDLHFATCCHDQLMVRFLNREETELISKVITTLSATRFRSDLNLVPQTAVVRQIARSETRHVVSEGDRGLVLVRGSVNDFIGHSPILIGKVRAWLKYVLDKLFDHEGRNFSNAFNDRFSRARSFELYCAGPAAVLRERTLCRSKRRNILSAVCMLRTSSAMCRGSFPYRSARCS